MSEMGLRKSTVWPEKDKSSNSIQQTDDKKALRRQWIYALFSTNRFIDHLFHCRRFSSRRIGFYVCAATGLIALIAGITAFAVTKTTGNMFISYFSFLYEVTI